MIPLLIAKEPVFWLLIALGIAAVVVYLERLLELRRSQIDWQDFVNGATNILDQGNVEEALSICEDTSAPVANIVATAIRNREASERSLKEAVDSQKRAESSRLARRLSVLSTIGEIAPILGLFGTILGFIKAIMLVEGQEVVARVDLMNATLSALVSTALGLGVMIPVLVMSAQLRNRMNRIVGGIDAAAIQIVNYFGAKK